MYATFSDDERKIKFTKILLLTITLTKMRKVAKLKPNLPKDWDGLCFRFFCKYFYI